MKGIARDQHIQQTSPPAVYSDASSEAYHEVSIYYKSLREEKAKITLYVISQDSMIYWSINFQYHTIIRI